MSNMYNFNYKMSLNQAQAYSYDIFFQMRVVYMPKYEF